MACDVELVSSSQVRPWADLLGEAGLGLAQLIAQETGDSLEVAATRIWCARECLKKAGLGFHNPLSLQRTEQPLVWLQSSDVPSLEKRRTSLIATWVLTTREIVDPIVIAILTESEALQYPTPD